MVSLVLEFGVTAFSGVTIKSGCEDKVSRATLRGRSAGGTTKITAMMAKMRIKKNIARRVILASFWKWTEFQRSTVSL
jgi:hypothetical protein